MKINSLFLLLIAFYHLILCDYDVYKNQFSIYFNRKIEKIDREKILGDEAINNLLYNNIYSSIKLGNNTQPISVFLIFNNSDIKLRTSSKYKNSVVKEMIIFMKSPQILNLSFIINESDNEKEGNKSYLGLSLNNNDNNKLSFINQLKESQLIERRIFSVLFKEKSITGDSYVDGQILFGLFPHEMTSRYNEKELNWIPVLNIGNGGWAIKFDTIKYFNEENSFEVKEVEFDLGMNLIIGPEEYRIKIYDNFFKYQIEKKVCKEEIFYNKKDNQFYTTYSCRHDLDVDEFPTLNFYSKDLNYSIVLDYFQLLCIFEKKIFFQVIFKKNAENKKWILGRSFMEVYPLVFDLDNQKIGFYKIKIAGDNPFVLGLLLIVIIIIMFVTIYRGKQLLRMESEQKEKNKKTQKDEKDIKDIDKKKDNKNDDNINNEKSKLKSE